MVSNIASGISALTPGYADSAGLYSADDAMFCHDRSCSLFVFGRSTTSTTLSPARPRRYTLWVMYPGTSPEDEGDDEVGNEEVGEDEEGEGEEGEDEEGEDEGGADPSPIAAEDEEEEGAEVEVEDGGEDGEAEYTAPIFSFLLSFVKVACILSIICHAANGPSPPPRSSVLCNHSTTASAILTSMLKAVLPCVLPPFPPFPPLPPLKYRGNNESAASDAIVTM